MFHPLKDFLDNALKRTGAERSVTANVIVEASGPILLQLIPNLRPADFKVISYHDGYLTVAVASPPVGQEIKIRAESILEALQDIFRNKPITRLKIVPLIEENEEFW